VTPPAADRLAALRLVATDVDGVMNEGLLWYGEGGEERVKPFHVRDGLGLRLLAEAGVAVAIVSARGAPPLLRRLEELGIPHVITGREDKAAALTDLCRSIAVPLAQVAFVGDDVLDLPAMRAAGLGVAVADAHPMVRAEAGWVTEAMGGRGALREVADAILEAKGGLAGHVERFLAGRDAGSGRGG
jgi:3-deoxy-D-manno-octulosonate 8-phosphate phosphatase (KDO 8-P phosphatase)